MPASVSAPLSSPIRVAVVTPTLDRAIYLNRSLAYFRSQDCPGAMLAWFIVDDSPAPNPAFAAGTTDGVFYRWLPARLPLGAKRNQLNDMALEWGAEFMCAMDDDDWYGPSYVSDMVGMLRRSDCRFAGSSENYFYHVPTGDILKARIAPPSSSGNGVLCYKAAALERSRYPDQARSGEDRAFLGDNAVLQHPEISRIHLALIHSSNTEDKDGIVKAEGNRTAMTLESFPMRDEDAAFYRALTAAAAR